VYINKFDLNTLDDVVEKLKGKNVYFSVDLDVLNPSEMPGTGTPEAGGISFKELLDGILKVGKLNVVAVDVCELAPPYDASGISTSLACKLVREMLLALKPKQ
jgi:agmatinase